jgi:hypothetical protein
MLCGDQCIFLRTFKGDFYEPAEAWCTLDMDGEYDCYEGGCPHYRSLEDAEAEWSDHMYEMKRDLC